MTKPSIEEAAATITRLNRRAQAAESAYRALRVLLCLDGKPRRRWQRYAEVVGKYERNRVAGLIGNRIIELVRELAARLPDDRRTFRRLRADAARVADADRLGDWTGVWAEQYVQERDALHHALAGMVHVVEALMQRRETGIDSVGVSALLATLDPDFLASLEAARKPATRDERR